MRKKYADCLVAVEPLLRFLRRKPRISLVSALEGTMLDFHLPLQLMLCRVAAVKRLPVTSNTAQIISYICLLRSENIFREQNI